MFCGECGAKNKKNDAFCSECGAPLEHEDEKQVVTTNVVKKSKQPMSKKNKIIIGVIAAMVLLLGIGYKIGSDITNPKAVAKNYIQATIDKDGDKLYKYLELDGDKTFVTKKIFKSLLKNSDIESSNVENYKITEVEYGDGKLSAKVKFTYTIKGSSSEKTDTVNLTKQKDKKFLFFDNWKIADMTAENLTMKDYTIKVAKGATVTYAGVKLTDKYLNKDESTSKLDVYVLPLVFTTETKLKTVLSNGLEIEETVTPSKYYSTHTVSFDEDSLTESAKEKIVNKAKESLNTIYTNAIARKQFNEIKSNFEHEGLDLSDFESSYNEFVSDLEDAYSKLTSINFTDLSIYDLEIDEDGNLEVEVKVNYDYTVSYTNWDDEVETHEDSYYSYMTVVLAYDKDAYYLVNIDDLEDYFSRY